METVEKSKKSKKSKKALAVFVIGVIVLVAGVATLIVKLVAQPGKSDAEFLVASGEWVAEDSASVVWDFTEIGKGKLTTDGHLNDYDFIWKIDGDKLAVETSWLYTLDDEFNYKLDQGSGVLTLTSADNGTEIKLKAKK